MTKLEKQGDWGILKINYGLSNLYNAPNEKNHVKRLKWHDNMVISYKYIIIATKQSIVKDAQLCYYILDHFDMEAAKDERN